MRGGKLSPPGSIGNPPHLFAASRQPAIAPSSPQAPFGRKSAPWGTEVSPRAATGGHHGVELFPLLEQARRGDIQVLGRFCQELRPCLVREVTRRLRGGWTEDWIEDVVQECLLDVLRGLHGCSANSEVELRAWARAIARRQVAILIHREWPRLESAIPIYTLNDLAESSATDPSPGFAALLAVLAAAADELTPTQSRLLWLRLQADATWREIGADLGITASAAKRRYQRLTASLRRRCLRVQA